MLQQALVELERIKALKAIKVPKATPARAVSG